MVHTKPMWDAQDSCHRCDEPISWGKPLATGNGNVDEIFHIDFGLKVVSKSYEGGQTLSLQKGNNVFATICRPCIVHFEMTKDKKTN